MAYKDAVSLHCKSEAAASGLKIEVESCVTELSLSDVQGTDAFRRKKLHFIVS